MVFIWIILIAIILILAGLATLLYLQNRKLNGLLEFCDESVGPRLCDISRMAELQRDEIEQMIYDEAAAAQAVDSSQSGSDANKEKDKEIRKNVAELNHRIISVLKKLGCNPEIENSSVRFNYQGKQFVMEMSETSYARRIVLPWIIARNITEKDDIHRLLDVVNKAMLGCWSGKFVWHVADIDDEQTFGLSLMIDHFITPEIPNLEDFLTMLLTSFFDCVNQMVMLFNASIDKEMLFSDIDYEPGATDNDIMSGRMN